MAFIDELDIYVKAGNGGSGVVRWRHEKGKDMAGPSGGNGGNGGDVFIKAVRDLAILSRYKNSREFRAENGADGSRSSRHGRNGKDLYIELPVGSVVTNLSTKRKFFLEKEGESFLISKGGRGGLGNEYFKASTNVRPKEFTYGKAGEESKFSVELELIAELGLVGLPNAGKSSLLNALTNAEAKVGNYEFTTVEPNLGDMHGYVIADIPGLIEGASAGRGLGHKFLRHIKRTKIILHCISIDSEDIINTYRVVRNELQKYDEDLFNKKEVIVLTKSDLVADSVLKEKTKEIKKENQTVFSVSVHNIASTKYLKDEIIKFLR